MTHFSWLTVFLLGMGWVTHWLVTVRCAKAAAKAAGTKLPTWRDYYRSDPEGFWISVVGLGVGYFVVPWLASAWPEAARFIGSTPENPMNPMAAYFGGAFMPLIIDVASRRFARMVGD